MDAFGILDGCDAWLELIPVAPPLSECWLSMGIPWGVYPLPGRVYDLNIITAAEAYVW